MTPDETKEYIEHRMRELGWAVQLDKAGYEKIYRYTDGTEAGANQLCYKLLSLGSLQSKREITPDIVSMAIDDLSRLDEILKKSARTGPRNNNSQEIDRLSIEQLASVLDTKVATSSDAIETRSSPERPARVADKSLSASTETKTSKSQARLVKILVADDSPTIRTAVTNALRRDFSFIEASDGEEAWKLLLKHQDVQLVVTDLMMPNLDGYDLIKRIRSTNTPPHLVGIPIIVVTALEDTNAKLRALVAGANDFITKNTEAAELQARVLARYKLSQTTRRSMPQAAAAPTVRTYETVGATTTNTAAKSQPKTAGNEWAGKASSASSVATAPPKGAPVVRPSLGAAGNRPFASNVPLRSARIEPSGSFFRKLYQISSTTTITLIATVLVAVAITIILYVNRNDVSVDNKNMKITIAEPSPEKDANAVPETLTVPPSLSDSTSESPKGNTNDALSGPRVTPAPQKETPKDITSPKSGRTSAKSAQDQSVAPPAPPASAPRKPEITPLPPQQSAASTKPGDSTLVRPPRAEVEQKTPPVAKTSPAPEVIAPTAPASSERAGSLPPAPAPSESTPSDLNVAKAAPAKPASDKLSPAELDAFARRFAFVYEAGDIEQFMALFSDDVRTNDRTTRAGVREDYEALFKSTDLRQMQLEHVNWELSNNEANGWGNFEVTVRQSGDQELNTYTGSLTFYVEKQKGRVRILRLYHGQRKVSGS